MHRYVQWCACTRHSRLNRVYRLFSIIVFSYEYANV